MPSWGKGFAAEFKLGKPARPRCFHSNWKSGLDLLCYVIMASFKSDHTGRLNFAMSDGSVHFISENIEYFVGRAVGDRGPAHLGFRAL